MVKLTVTGGVLSLAKSGDNPQFTDTELEAVVSAAKTMILLWPSCARSDRDEAGDSSRGGFG